MKARGRNASCPVGLSVCTDDSEVRRFVPGFVGGKAW